MKYKIKKKLIHFYTGGNIAEDFVASRRKKVSALRKVIRACFYLHCAAALLCIGLSVLLGSAPVVVAITLCTVAAAWIALFAVGGSGMTKLLIAADAVFSAAGFTAGSTTSYKAAFFSCAAVMVLAAGAAVIMYCAARCRDYLEGFSPRLIRRDDYTLLANFAPETEDIKLSKDEELPPLPPLTSEMRELAMQLKEILSVPAEKEPEEELIDEITHSSAHVHETEEKTPVENAE